MNSPSIIGQYTREMTIKETERVTGGEGKEDGCVVYAVTCPLCGSPELTIDRVGCWSRGSGMEIYRCKKCYHEWYTGRD